MAATSAPKPAPEPAEPTGPRGADTRAQLLESGLRLFATLGYDGVSTRALSAEAGTNIAAIAYHFGGKRELYRAILRQLVIDTEPYTRPQLDSLAANLSGARDRPRVLAGLITGLVAGLAGIFLSSEFMRHRAPLIMREYAHPSEDFDILYEGRIEPLHKAMTELCAAAMGRPGDDPVCAIQAHAMLGQIVVFGIARVVLQRRLGWERYTPERITLITRQVSASVLASLGLAPPDKDGESE